MKCDSRIMMREITDLETNDHDDKCDHHEGSVTTLEHQLVPITLGWHHSVYQGSWRYRIRLIFDV